MAKINENFLNLQKNYLFVEIAKRVKNFADNNPDKKLIRLGIGDVTLPLADIVVDEMKKGCDELGVKETFKGYPDGEGYAFVREAISGYYDSFGVKVNADEIFISDGAKSDTGNIGDIFGKDNKVLVTDPVYPVYVDTNIMSGREIVYVGSNEKNGFSAMPDKNISADIIYLCSPNNPTGSAYTAEQLKEWVDFAIENKSIIMYDAAYEAFITEDGIPRSIFEIDGARKCAIEFCSLSKTAGFTGTRCGYTVIPKELVAYSESGEEFSVHTLWNRRQGSKFNGVSYPIQRAAAAVFSKEGQKQTKENLAYYKENAKIIAEACSEMGIYYTGGTNSPYIWLKCPNGFSSWEFFDYLLEKANVVGTPGAGFGANGEGFFRLTAFGDRDNTIEAVRRIKALNLKP